MDFSDVILTYLEMKFMVMLILLGKALIISCGFDIMILHAGDINAEFEESTDQIGGFSRILQYVHQRRTEAEKKSGPPVLVLMTGNFFGGNIWYTVHRWSIVSDFINLLNPDAIALGTREFSDGIQVLTDFLTSLKCPVVGTNLVVNQKLPLKDLILKFSIIHIKDKKIMILGYTNRGYITTKSIDFVDAVQAIKDQCSIIKKRNDIDYVIAIGHAGYEIDKNIALYSDCVRLVIGSNSKMFMYKGNPPSSENPTMSYPSMIKLSDDSLIPVVHSYINGKYLGEIIIRFDNKKELIEAVGNPILLDKSIKQNVSGLGILQKYREELERKKKRIIAKTLTSLDGNSCNTSECTLGNIITDSFCNFKATQSPNLYWTSASIGLINSGSIKASLNITTEGKFINEAFLYKTLPFQEQLMTVRLSGLTLFNIFERSMKGLGTKAFLQVSGLKVVYNDSIYPPQMEIFVRCAKCEVPIYNLLNESLEYDVIMTNYLAEGGDDYDMIVRKKITYNTEVINALQATIRYLEDYKKVIGEKGNRLMITSSEENVKNNRWMFYCIFIFFIF